MVIYAPPIFFFPKNKTYSPSFPPAKKRAERTMLEKNVRNGDECATYILIIIASAMPPHARLGTGRGRGWSEEGRREEFLSGRFFDVDSPSPPRIIIIVMRKMNTKYMKIEIYVRTLCVLFIPRL